MMTRVNWQSWRLNGGPEIVLLLLDVVPEELKEGLEEREILGQLNS